METVFTEKDFYAQHFPPKVYLDAYYSVGDAKVAENPLLPFALKTLHKAFILDGIKGDTLIDIGSGPTIYQYLSACESFREIIPTDYSKQNHEEMQRWLKKEPDAFDWSPVVKYVCELEGDRLSVHGFEYRWMPILWLEGCRGPLGHDWKEKWAEKEELLRRTIKRVLKCDVTQPNPLAPLVLPPADCLLSCLCLEGACKDLPTFCSALKNISSLLKPGGHLVLFSVLQETFYMIGQQRFSCLFLERKFLEEAIAQAGFDIKWLKETSLSFPLSKCDVKGACTIVAQKHPC